MFSFFIHIVAILYSVDADQSMHELDVAKLHRTNYNGSTNCSPRRVLLLLMELSTQIRSFCKIFLY